jgi:hypothetical protein
MAEEAGREPASLSVTLGGAPEDLAVLRRNRDLGVTRMTVRLPPAKEAEIWTSRRSPHSVRRYSVLSASKSMK